MTKILKGTALALVIAGVVAISPASAGNETLCSMEANTFNLWFYQLFYC